MTNSWSQIALAGSIFMFPAASLCAQTTRAASADQLLIPAFAAVAGNGGAQQAGTPVRTGSFIERYQARVSATQAEQRTGLLRWFW